MTASPLASRAATPATRGPEADEQRVQQPQRPLDAPAAVGFGRIVASETEASNMLVDMV